MCSRLISIYVTTTVVFVRGAEAASNSCNEHFTPGSSLAGSFSPSIAKYENNAESVQFMLDLSSEREQLGVQSNQTLIHLRTNSFQHDGNNVPATRPNWAQGEGAKDGA